MAELFVLRLGRQPDRQVGWLVADDDGTRRSPPAAGTLEEASAAVQGRPVIVLVPATEALTMTVDLPIRRGPRLLAALPYALEEQIATDVETMHFAAGDKRESGRRPVAAISRDALDAWLESLSEVGIQPWKVVPENYGLARIPGTMSVLIDDDCVMFNDGEDLEFALDGAKPSDALVASGHLEERSDDAPPEQSGHLIVYCSAADEERLSHDWIALRHELHSVDINLLPDGALPRLAVTVASGAGVNLLQGRYGPKADYGDAGDRRVRGQRGRLLATDAGGSRPQGPVHNRFPADSPGQQRRYPRSGRRREFHQAQPRHDRGNARVPRLAERAGVGTGAP